MEYLLTIIAYIAIIGFFYCIGKAEQKYRYKKYLKGRKRPVDFKTWLKQSEGGGMP